MAFTFNALPIIAPEQSGIGNAALQKAMQTYMNINQMAYQRPQLQETLQEKILKNKYYGPDIESQIGLRGAQAGLVGEQTKGARLQNEFYPQEIQSKLMQQAIQQNLLRQIVGGMGGAGNVGNAGGVGGASNVGLESMNPMQQNANRSSIPSTGFGNMQQNEPVQPAQMGETIGEAIGKKMGLTYPQAALGMHLLGLGQPKIENINGTYTAMTPFGNIEVAKGPTKLQEALATRDADVVNNLEQAVIGSTAKQDALNGLSEIIASPEFEAMRQNPLLGSYELRAFARTGTPQQQELIGKARSYMGDIIKSSANDFKGQFRTGEQTLLNNMKPSETDSLNVMKGKMEALQFMQQSMVQRAQIEADAIRNKGLDPIAAKLYADKMIDTKALKQEIKSMLNPHKPTPEGALMELKKRKGQF